MSERPRLSGLDFWSSYERACLEVIREALSLLPDGCVDRNEDDINRELFRAIQVSTHRQRQATGSVVGAVTYEGRSTPAPSDRDRSPRELKRPDFYWAWIDDLDPDPALSRREFVVECKRLAPPISGRDFPRLYVKEGIARFVDSGHGYGKEMRSGAMVGYLQRITVADAAAAVNAATAEAGIPPLMLQAQDDARADLTHELTRDFPVSPFRLSHVWGSVT